MRLRGFTKSSGFIYLAGWLTSGNIMGVRIGEISNDYILYDLADGAGVLNFMHHFLLLRLVGYAYVSNYSIRVLTFLNYKLGVFQPFSSSKVICGHVMLNGMGKRISWSWEDNHAHFFVSFSS